MVETHDWVRLPVRVMIIELAKNRVMRETGSDFAMRANRIRRSLASRGMCRFVAGMGIRNELWIDPQYEAKIGRVHWL